MALEIIEKAVQSWIVLKGINQLGLSQTVPDFRGFPRGVELFRREDSRKPVKTALPSLLEHEKSRPRTICLPALLSKDKHSFASFYLSL
jgi:hypothetical protein